MLEGSNFAIKPTNPIRQVVGCERREDHKSRGTFIKASTWLKHFDADSLLYYYTAKLSSADYDIT